MKKIILSALVVFGFLGYSWNQSVNRSLPDNTSTSGLDNASKTSSDSHPQVSTNSNVTYKDGEYIGDVTDAFFGNVQVKAVIKLGKIADVIFLDYPQDRHTSVEINKSAMPLLKSEAIKNQTYNVDVISGATQTSEAFVLSLKSALNKAL